MIALGVWSRTMSGQSAPPANDWMVVPGARVGPITAGSTRADLRKFFSSDAVRDEDIELDKLLRPGTFVFRGTPAETLAIFWTGRNPTPIQRKCFFASDGAAVRADGKRPAASR